jgi:hypothetical protein
VDHGQAQGTGGGEHPSGRRDRRPQGRHVVAERLTEATRLNEVALEVDADQRGTGRLELVGRRVGGDGDH